MSFRAPSKALHLLIPKYMKVYGGPPRKERTHRERKERRRKRGKRCFRSRELIFSDEVIAGNRRQTAPCPFALLILSNNVYVYTCLKSARCILCTCTGNMYIRAGKIAAYGERTIIRVKRNCRLSIRRHEMLRIACYRKTIYYRQAVVVFFSLTFCNTFIGFL